MRQLARVCAPPQRGHSAPVWATCRGARPGLPFLPPVLPPFLPPFLPMPGPPRGGGTYSGAPFRLLGDPPRHPGHPIGQKKSRSLQCFARGSLARALTPRIGLPERIPAPGCGIQLQGQFSHPWGTPGRGYDPRRGHLGLAEAPNLNAFTPCSTSGAHTCAAISGLLHSRKPLLMGRTPTRPPPASLRVHPAQLWVSPSSPCGMRCETWWMVWGRLVRDAVALMDPELAVVHW